MSSESQDVERNPAFVLRFMKDKLRLRGIDAPSANALESPWLHAAEFTGGLYPLEELPSMRFQGIG